MIHVTHIYFCKYQFLTVHHPLNHYRHQHRHHRHTTTLPRHVATSADNNGYNLTYWILMRLHLHYMPHINIITSVMFVSIWQCNAML